MKRDPRHHVLPGQPLRLAAEQINALNRMMRVNAGAAGGPVDIPGPAKNVILCRNDSGSDVVRWGVLEISGVVFDPADGSDAEATFTSTPCVTGVTPTDSAKPFVIAVEPIAAGKIGRAAVAGVVQCKLDVTAAGDGTAGGKPGSRSELTTGSGSARILWKQSGTGGGKWGLVAIGGGGGTSIRMCKTIADWEVGSTQLVELWEYGDFPAEARNDPIQRFTAHNKLFRVKSGAFVYIGKAGNGRWYLIGAGRATEDYNSDPDGGLTLGCAGVAVGSEDLTSLPGYSAGKQQILSHVNGCLRWVDVVGCSA